MTFSGYCSYQALTISTLHLSMQNNCPEGRHKRSKFQLKQVKNICLKNRTQSFHMCVVNSFYKPPRNASMKTIWPIRRDISIMPAFSAQLMWTSRHAHPILSTEISTFQLFEKVIIIQPDYQQFVDSHNRKKEIISYR